MVRTRIVVVDDEISIIKFLRANLEARNYEVLTAMNGAEALQLVEMEMPDLIILDILMPKMDGFEVCRRIRKWSPIPIIMLSARADEGDKVKCLDLGADDYITKPFGAKELIARVSAVLRRTDRGKHLTALPSFTSGDLEVNFAQRQVIKAGEEVQLTPTEYALLQELVQNAGKVLTHTHLLDKVWGLEYRDERQYLHVFIRRLRNKLEPEPTKPRCILTVRAVGYRFSASA